MRRFGNLSDRNAVAGGFAAIWHLCTGPECLCSWTLTAMYYPCISHVRLKGLLVAGQMRPWGICARATIFNGVL